MQPVLIRYPNKLVSDCDGHTALTKPRKTNMLVPHCILLVQKININLITSVQNTRIDLNPNLNKIRCGCPLEIAVSVAKFC